MASDLSKDLMLAILAMDSYNRGYNPSLDIDSIKTIGTATFSTDSSRIPGFESTRDSGFYAVQYSWDGKTVISYRGTDNDGVFAKPDKGASDIWSGWSIGAGNANASQATWAEKFYKAVTGQEVDAATAPSPRRHRRRHGASRGRMAEEPPVMAARPPSSYGRTRSSDARMPSMSGRSIAW